METDRTLDHETTLEHALDIARKNHKEAQRLLDEAKAAFGAGEVGDDRVKQLQALLDIAVEDLRRVMKEQ